MPGLNYFLLYWNSLFRNRLLDLGDISNSFFLFRLLEINDSINRVLSLLQKLVLLFLQLLQLLLDAQPALLVGS